MFGQLQGQRPQTLACVLAGLCAGLIGWNGQLFGDSVDVGFALVNMVICWVTGASASSVRFYYEDTHADATAELTTVPVGLASFVGGFMSIGRFVDRDHKNVVSWHGCAAVGHYATHLVPDVLIAELRSFRGGLLVDRASVLVGGVDVLADGTDVCVGCGLTWFRHVWTGTTSRAAWDGFGVGVVVGMTCRVGPILTCDLIVHVWWLTPSGCGVGGLGRGSGGSSFLDRRFGIADELVVDGTVWLGPAHSWGQHMVVVSGRRAGGTGC